MTAVLNRRGFAQVPVTGDHPLDPFVLSDFDEAFEYIEEKHGVSSIHLLGFSQGANMLQYYLGSRGKNAHKLVKTGTAVSSPHDFMMALRKIDSSKMLQKTVLALVKSDFKANMRYQKFVDFIEKHNIDF